MSAEIVKTIAAYIALAVPITFAVTNLAKIILEWLSQRHTIKTAYIQQTHQITTHYLDRALDPQVPLVIRHQLLRFLATSDKDSSRLSTWAESELKRIGEIVEEASRAVQEAEKNLNAAQTVAQVADAERKLEVALKLQKSLVEPPKIPQVTPASLRAGLIEENKLNGLIMRDSDLMEMHLIDRELRNADFSGSNLSNSIFWGCDLRVASFVGCDLTRTQFYAADLRGSDFTRARLIKTDFHKARLEGANLHEAIFEDPDLRATYDEETIWPENYIPDDHGAVWVGAPKHTKQETKRDELDK